MKARRFENESFFHFSVIKEGLASSSESLTAGTSTTISPTKHFIKIYDSGLVAFVVASLSILEFCELTLERTSRVEWRRSGRSVR